MHDTLRPELREYIRRLNLVGEDVRTIKRDVEALQQGMTAAWANLSRTEVEPNPYITVPACPGKMKKMLFGQWLGYMPAKVPLAWDPIVSNWKGCGVIPQPSFMPFFMDSTCTTTAPAGTPMAIAFQLDANLFFLWYQIGKCTFGATTLPRIASCPSSLTGVDLSVTNLFGPTSTLIQGVGIAGGQCASPTNMTYGANISLPNDPFNGRGWSGIRITDVP